MTLDIKQIWCGGHMQKPSMKLKAGMLEMLYENGNIRYVSAGSTEILRMIYSAVRDRNWLTINPLMTSEEISRHSGSFDIKYDCHYKCEDIDLKARYKLTGNADSSVVIEFEGEILERTVKNRVGFCVLHPIEGIAGKPCTITHSDSSQETLFFPSEISPHQPFLDIRAMKWDMNGYDCILEFSGDIFETEDQRNWSDSSFKTYSTPLSIPYPATLEKGETIKQKIVFRISENEIKLQEQNDITGISLFRDIEYPLPANGIGRTTRSAPIEENELGLIREVNFDHYRCDLYLFDDSWAEKAEQAAEEAKTAGCLNEFILFFDENFRNQIVSFCRWLENFKSETPLVTILHKTEKVTPSELYDYCVPLLKLARKDIHISSGTNANFAELNRDKHNLAHSEGISYAIHPQEHASDNTTLIENINSQKYSVESSHVFFPGKKIHVSPVNIQRRFNANKSNYEVPETGGGRPMQVDSRMMSLFGACWTAGSFKYLAEAGVNVITWYESVGERGIMQGNYESAWPDYFKSKPGMLFPVYHIFRWLLCDRSFKVIRSVSTSPLHVEVVALASGMAFKAALINYGHMVRRVSLKVDARDVTSYCLETESFEAASKDPLWIERSERLPVSDLSKLNLGPFSVTFIDGILNA